MRKHQTVQNPLGTNEIFELGSTLMQSLPRNLDADKVRADLMHKTGLARDLGKFFRDRYAAQAFADAEAWQSFYERLFGKKIDLSGLQLTPKPEGGLHRPILVVPGLITHNDAFDACKKLFGAWRYTDDLNTVRDIVERPKAPYVVWVKNVVEADSDLANISADEIEKRKINPITLLERLILELKHFDETKKHLDIENWTLCAGSRYADGYVPRVGWYSLFRELYVSWALPHDAHARLRARAAV